MSQSVVPAIGKPAPRAIRQQCAPAIARTWVGGRALAVRDFPPPAAPHNFSNGASKIGPGGFFPVRCPQGGLIVTINGWHLAVYLRALERRGD